MSEIDCLMKGLDSRTLTELVRIAETTERYEDMTKMVKKLIELKSKKGDILDVDQRNLFSVAYKNVVDDKRKSLGALKGDDKGIDQKILNKYIYLIENELELICKEVTKLLTQHLCKIKIYTKLQIDFLCSGYIKKYIMMEHNIPNEIMNLCQSYFPPIDQDKNDLKYYNFDEMEVWYLKMAGDYYKFLEEIKPNKYKLCAETFYIKSTEIANQTLNDDHPTKLKLALNFSVYYYEIAKRPQKAMTLALNAFADALNVPDSLGGPCYKDHTLILQLIRDNLVLWGMTLSEITNRLN